jgi:hypothetical protein
MGRFPIRICEISLLLVQRSEAKILLLENPNLVMDLKGAVLEGHD